MRDWQANPFCRGFRHLSFPFLASLDLDFALKERECLLIQQL
jgi:hypothetical protein